MTKEEKIKKLITQFQLIFTNTLLEGVEVSFLEGLRQIDGPVPKSNEQMKLEKRLEEKQFLLVAMKNEIVQLLGVEVEVAEMKLDEFWDFLQRQ